ncbi:MAG: quinol:cytochrome C oxidoreductase [Elusimicrobiota bacterium]
MRIAALGVLGAAGVAASYFAAGPARFWVNWIIWMLFLASVGLGALFLIALEHLFIARWSVPLRRTAERVSGLVLPAGAAFVAALFCLPVLYPWTRPEVMHHPLVAGKTVWLNIPFFCVRTLICVGLWALSYRVFFGGSLSQDATKDPAMNLRARRFAPVFMALFALTVTVAAFDWISSLQPEWYSDILGVYLFAGVFLAGLAGVTAAALHLQDKGRLPGVRGDHLYNLGALMFAFTVFWSYIAFAQYMLIWYANLPEEIVWYKARVEGPWLPVILFLALIHFVVPFAALAARDSKKDPRRLMWVAWLVLFSHWVDLYWLVYPELGIGPRFSWPELSFALMFVCLGLAWMKRQFTLGEDMPVGDPFLKEGLEFRL